MSTLSFLCKFVMLVFCISYCFNCGMNDLRLNDVDYSSHWLMFLVFTLTINIYISYLTPAIDHPDKSNLNPNSSHIPPIN